MILRNVPSSRLCPVFAFVIICSSLLGGCATPSNPKVNEVQWQADQMCLMIKQYANGLSEMILADELIEDQKLDDAQKHVAKAQVYFAKAGAYLAKTGFSKDGEEVRMLNDGIASLERANKALDKTDAKNAEENLEQAAQKFEDFLKTIEAEK